MKKVLKIFNPFIFLINLFMYFAHLHYEMETRSVSKGIYERYNFKKDFKYF